MNSVNIPQEDTLANALYAPYDTFNCLAAQPDTKRIMAICSRAWWVGVHRVVKHKLKYKRVNTLCSGRKI